MRLRIILGLVLLSWIEPALAWDPDHHRRIADDAMRFLPPTLQGLMRLYETDFDRGVEEANAYARQFPISSAEERSAALDREMQELVALINEHKPFGLIFYRFGRLIGPLSELNLPMPKAEPPPLLQEMLANFQRITVAGAPQFRISWNGYQEELMRSVPPHEYFLTQLRASQELFPVLYGAMIVNGKPVPPETFDFLSIPFGVASVSYSRTINLVVNVWCAIWRAAGGDMSGRPY